MVIRTGIIGLSKGNGHPFSYSAIVNGYDDLSFKDAGWPQIHDYLRLQPNKNFGIQDVLVTHAWTQDSTITTKLCAACNIQTPCASPMEMLGQVDALIIARDDWESHAEMALPFLREGVSVFVDKPLTLSDTELETFVPFLQQGKLMSCSGMRYSVELDSLRVKYRDTGQIRLISGTILNDPEKYGIHLMEAVASLGGDFAQTNSVTKLEAPHDSFLLHLANSVPFHLDCLGNVEKTYHLSFFGESAHLHFDLHDNFSAFRRTLEQFFIMVQTGVPPFEPMETINLMKVLGRITTLKVGETADLNFAGVIS